jgi:hypothetical protein
MDTSILGQKMDIAVPENVVSHLPKYMSSLLRRP